MDSQYDTTILSIFMNICRNSGMRYVSLDNPVIHNNYERFASVYNELRKISVREYTNKPLDLNIINESLKSERSIEWAIHFMNKLINKKKEEQELIDLDAEYHKKIKDLMHMIETSGINSKSMPIVRSFYEEYRIINIWHDRNGRANDLKVLIQKINKFSNLYKQEIEALLLKINDIRIMTLKNQNIGLLYPEASAYDLTKELISIVTEKKSDIVKFSKKLDIIYEKVQELSTINLESMRSYPYASMIEDRINGILLEISPSRKTCKIKFDRYRFPSTLSQYKQETFIRILKQKLAITPTDEIAKRAEVNESQLSKFLNGKDFPAQEVLKYSIDTLLLKLGVYKEFQQETLNKEMYFQSLKEENTKSTLKVTNKFNELHRLLEILSNDEYLLMTENKKSIQVEDLFNLIFETYRRINLPKSFEQEIEKTLKKELALRCKQENLLYSNIQSVYNCLDRDLIKKMHSELSCQMSIDTTSSISKVILIIKKYARKNNGEIYTEEEILNFLKQKNQIEYSENYTKGVPGYFLEEGLERTISVLSEYDENNNIGLADIYEILYKISGKRR